MAFFHGLFPYPSGVYLDKTLAQNIPLKVSCNLFKFWCLLFAIINNNFQQIAVCFLLESSEIDGKKGY